VRRKTFLYPKEAAALLACNDVPREWREIYAVALYTYLRPGELRVLTWADVDLDVPHFHVTMAWDYTAKDDEPKTKPPKTRNGVRYSFPSGSSRALELRPDCAQWAY
jgi:integrase